MEIDEDLLTQDLVFTANALHASNSTSFILRNYSMFQSLNGSLSANFNKRVVVKNMFKNPELMTRLMEKSRLRSITKLTDFVNDNEQSLITLSDNFEQMNKDIDFTFYPIPCSRIVYNRKEFEDLIISYFATYGDRIYKIVKRYFDEKRIQTGNLDIEDGYGGYTAWIQWLESGYVFSNLDRYNLINAAVVCHELGHAIDCETFYFPQQKQHPTLADPFVEIPSTAYEMGFIDYLKANHIDVNGAQMYFNHGIDQLKDYFEELNKVLKLEESCVTVDGYAIDKEDHKALDELFWEIMNEYKANRRKIVGESEETDQKRDELTQKMLGDINALDELEEELSYNMRDDLLYGLGYYTALHLGLIREGSIQDYNRVLNNICTSRKEIDLATAIDMMGISLDDYISGKLIKPKLEENCLALRKRYKF